MWYRNVKVLNCWGEVSWSRGFEVQRRGDEVSRCGVKLSLKKVDFQLLLLTVCYSVFCILPNLLLQPWCGCKHADLIKLCILDKMLVALRYILEQYSLKYLPYFS